MLRSLFVLLIVAFSLFGDSSEFWLVDEFSKINTSENQKQIEFSKIVSNKSVKLNSRNTIPIKIVIVYPGEQVSDYWRRSRDSFVKRLDELNVNYVLQDFFTKPEVEVRKQGQLILDAIKNSADYIVFTLDIKLHERFIDKIISMGKPKIILQNITTPKKSWGDNQPFMYVGFDHQIGSKLLADYYLSSVDKNGKYAVLYGSQGYVSSMRGDTFIRYIEQNSKLKLVDSYYVHFNRAKAKEATLEILNKHTDLEFIYACSTDIAHGVTDALKEKNLIGKIKVNGWGGGSSELKAIEDKELDVTVMRINDDNGVAMAEAIKKDLLGQSSSIPLIFSGEFAVIKQDTKKDKLEDLKSRSFRYSN